MQVRRRNAVKYTLMWGAVVAAAVVVVPRLLPDWEPERAPLPEAYAGAGAMPESLMEDGTTILVGDPQAATVVRLFEDPRCPVVADFEASGGKAVRAHTLQRRTVTAYTFASFKDGSLGGDGSKRAVNALRAALEAQKFAEYHDVLMERQGEVEASGGYTTERLLALADLVPGLRSEDFDAAVTTLRYGGFVSASQKAYEQSTDEPDGPGTPTVVINRTIIGGTYWEGLFREADASELLTAVERTPEILNRLT